jgi:hypothetical protein
MRQLQRSGTIALLTIELCSKITEHTDEYTATAGAERRALQPAPAVITAQAAVHFSAEECCWLGAVQPRPAPSSDDNRIYAEVTAAVATGPCLPLSALWLGLLRGGPAPRGSCAP